MSLAEELFENALERLDEADEAMLMVSAASLDVDYRLAGHDTGERLATLLEAIHTARRSLSQAAGWVNETIDHLDRRGPDDDPAAGGEREGQGQALPGCDGRAAA